MRQPRSPHAAEARLAASLVVLMHLAAVAVCAQDARAEQFGNVLFRSPAGWRRVESFRGILSWAERHSKEVRWNGLFDNALIIKRLLFHILL